MCKYLKQFNWGRGFFKKTPSPIKLQPVPFSFLLNCIIFIYNFPADIASGSKNAEAFLKLLIKVLNRRTVFSGLSISAF